MSRWTAEQWLGLDKLRDDWNEVWPWWTPGKVAFHHGWGLVKDGSGHVLIGLLIGAVPAYLCELWWIPWVCGTAFGAGREVWQFLSDSTPNPNLVDRLKDTLEIGLGGLLVGLIL